MAPVEAPSSRNVKRQILAKKQKNPRDPLGGVFFLRRSGTMPFSPLNPATSGSTV